MTAARSGFLRRSFSKRETRAEELESMASKFRKIKSCTGEVVILGEDVTSADINEHYLFEFTNKYFVDYVYFCFPNAKFFRNRPIKVLQA